MRKSGDLADRNGIINTDEKAKTTINPMMTICNMSNPRKNNIFFIIPTRSVPVKEKKQQSYPHFFFNETPSTLGVDTLGVDTKRLSFGLGRFFLEKFAHLVSDVIR